MKGVRLDLTRGVEAALNELAEAAKARTPVRSGGLRASCRVRVRADGLGGEAAYGAPYAIAQHENRGLRHPRGGQAKYLEDAARDAGVRERMLRALAEGVRAEWRTK